MWLYMCLCCGFLYPHNSVSNVVVSVTIHDNIQTKIIYLYIYIRNVAKKNETLVEGQKLL